MSGICQIHIKRQKILLLGAATSALDPKLKAELITSIKTFMKGKTVISIAHS
ncbi:hypothetical protein L1077_19975 [Pseudoalteromonas luteoviolacea]|uniref:hypothetical protein n=1 Tax=Pseudoalteromonas luteoviolacea TaxID=43657 RepID=UPI001F2BA894|nr:hypothetical protein [Pseudoalteromonas luteoviolacea]MCF6441718.1 hypothetical protein [Pseudoalteromonas luteoviolacea]